MEEDLEMLKFFAPAGYLMIVLPRNKLDKKRLIRMWQTCFEKRTLSILDNFHLLYMELISVALLNILVYRDSLYTIRKKYSLVLSININIENIKIFLVLSIAQSWETWALWSLPVSCVMLEPLTEGRALIKSIIPPLRICCFLDSSLIWVKPSFLLNKDWFVVVILWCSQPLHLGYISKAPLLLQWFILWVINP